MPNPIYEFLSTVDQAALQRQADELQEELQAVEALLVLARRYASGSLAHSTAVEPIGNGSNVSRIVGIDLQSAKRAMSGGRTNGKGHKRLTEKRAEVLSIMQERPGRWTPADVRKALEARGVDPVAGTPVKNILWHLAQDGVIHGSGNGVYEFPPLSAEADREGAITR